MHEWFPEIQLEVRLTRIVVWIRAHQQRRKLVSFEIPPRRKIDIVRPQCY
jgi:hypothetical protein